MKPIVSKRIFNFYFDNSLTPKSTNVISAIAATRPVKPSDTSRFMIMRSPELIIFSRKIYQ